MNFLGEEKMEERGEGIRKGFTDHLYDKLQWRAIKTFKDDQGLERGTFTFISPELHSAIEESQYAIVGEGCLFINNKLCLALGWKRFFVKGLKRAIWPSIGDGGKYGHVLFIKILISWRILEGQRAKTSPLASHRRRLARFNFRYPPGYPDRLG
ncbi:hypothetical protein DVH24_030612 [Malus domestica]|uniref:TIR domain-containing protein n=1 Tax=Malus domestica TaxID=3750 RepID=A0A498K496_MALDO|nr:hypothetical protein DVH24_030612 [Malus domestica]